MTSTPGSGLDSAEVLEKLQQQGLALGFSQIGVAGVDLSDAEPGLLAWLSAGFHGQMDYMQRHGVKRARPAELVPGTASVITARMDYLPQQASSQWQAVEWARLDDPARATVSLYARGRDYHKVLRSRLQQFATQLAQWLGPLGHRVFTDSAPVLEVELATRSGIGWRGKHTLALDRKAGSMFFLGEIYVDMVLPTTNASSAHCGRCTACIDVCPTQAIIAPYRLDARRCISYLTIEHEGPIPEPLRPLMGNRIYGCDDCQLICPWNKYAQRSTLPDFDVREPLGDVTLLLLWQWTAQEFARRTEGSPIRRIGYQRWRRNLAIALGNLLRSTQPPAALKRAVREALQDQLQANTDSLITDHIGWALTAPQTNAKP